MGRVTTDHSQSGSFLAVLISTLLALCIPSATVGQTVAGNSTTVQGFIRNANGQGLAGAIVYLRGTNATPTLTTRTNAMGDYTFSELSAGTYSLHAEMAGTGEATSDSFVIGEKEARKVDLTISRGESREVPGSASGPPEFFDEPKFTVAGVTDTANSGGHGSDTVRRTGETLAKDTVALTATPQNRLQQSSQAGTERSLREASQREPDSFDANHRLGTLLADSGRAGEALPFLDRASRLNPSNFDNRYALAAAYSAAGQYEKARAEARLLLREKDTADLHHLLADVDEKLGDPLDSVKEYQRAAEIDASEPDLFAWGAELLLHNAIEPAGEVFSKGNRLYPRSARMLIGLGVALYSRGSYDQAAECLYHASDLNPNDPDPYLFLGKMQSLGIVQSADLVGKLRRFAQLQPENALSNYYYALGLWQRRQQSAEASDLAEVESLLQKVVRLDPKLGAAYLQLGILYAERRDFPKAIIAYQNAMEASPELEQAHFRLAQAYARSGDKLKAQQQIQLYEALSTKEAEEVERQRHEMRQFVYQLQGQAAASPPR
jgi:tetratricopeptide (TPR) repeat protein